MKKIGSLSDWEYLDADEFLSVPVTRSRRAQLSLNAEHETRLYYYPLKKDGEPDKRGKPVYLATVKGLETVQFKTPMSVAVVADQSIAVRTNIGQTLTKYEASETFTKMIERQSVNPDVAAVVQRANANQRQFMRQMQEMNEFYRGELAKQNETIAEHNKRMSKEVYERSNENLGKSHSSDAPAAPEPQSTNDGGASNEPPSTNETGGGDQKNEQRYILASQGGFAPP